MGDTSPEKKSGCGLLSVFFGRRPPRTSSSSSPVTVPTANVNGITRSPSTPNSKRRRGGSTEAFLDDSSVRSDQNSQKQGDRIIDRPGPNHSRCPSSNVVYQQHQVPGYSQGHGRKGSDHDQITVARSAPPSQVFGVAKKVPQGAVGLSGELESMIQDHQRSKGAGSLVRASSSNVMLHGNLGNLRQGGGNGNTNSANVLDFLPKTAREEPMPSKVATNVVKERSEKPKKPESLCRGLSTRMDPEELKILGNEDYKNGRFAEALALYDAAISIDPSKASYRSNKSAALTALGRLLEAVFECREAIRIEPHNQRAHNRLANLHLRLGEAEKTMYHYKYAGAEADPDVLAKARKLQGHLNKCTEAKMQRDWNAVLREAGLAISAGADSAPQIFALKAEALLKLQRLQEADDTLKSGPKFDDDDCTKFFGPIGFATILVIRAQVDMAAGRFDDAVEAGQLAVKLDSNNKEATTVVRRIQAVAIARSNGNDHFKVGKYSEACNAYGEGLYHDPNNAVLLSNRAACRSKLGQYDKALEDCNAAVRVRPSYNKARLRRADCYLKLQKWEACIQDCQVLLKDSPDDEEAKRMLEEAEAALRSQN